MFTLVPAWDLTSHLSLQKLINRRSNRVKEVLASYHHQETELPDSLIDKLLGLPVKLGTEEPSDPRVRQQYGQEQLTYEGTPYRYIRQFLHTIRPSSEDVIYDLGCGYGRVVLYAALVSPAKIRGVELLGDRLQLAKKLKNRFNLDNAEFIRTNVLATDFSDGTAFFMFNPFSPQTFYQVLQRLYAVALSRPITIAAWGGGPTEILSNQTWLELRSGQSIFQPNPNKLKIFRSNV